MPDSVSPRERIAAEQSALLQALLTGGAPPAGFDVERINMAGEALKRKRVRTMMRAHPRLKNVGDDLKLSRHLSAYIKSHPCCHANGPYEDGQAFLFYLRFGRWLERVGL